METSVLAINTTDAISILRVGPFVIKHFRQRHFDYLHDWNEQIALRVAVSRSTPILDVAVVNPVLWYADFVAISRFIPGDRIYGARLQLAAAALKPFGIHDVTSANLIDCGGVPVLIDFMVSPV